MMSKKERLLWVTIVVTVVLLFAWSFDRIHSSTARQLAEQGQTLK